MGATLKKQDNRKKETRHFFSKLYLKEAWEEYCIDSAGSSPVRVVNIYC